MKLLSFAILTSIKANGTLLLQRGESSVCILKNLPITSKEKQIRSQNRMASNITLTPVFQSTLPSEKSPSFLPSSLHPTSVSPPYPAITCAKFSQHLQRKTPDPPSNFPFSAASHSFKRQTFTRAAAEYKFPDPIPEFADAETEKFRAHLVKKLSKKDVFGDSLDEVVAICTEILNTFLHTEYGGPGTLLVVPFIDMADTLDEQGLPGGPQAARTAVKWAQDNVDKDWKEWTSRNK